MLVKKISSTYEECKGCGCSYQHQVKDIYHPPYQDQVAKGTHSGHLSVGNKCEHVIEGINVTHILTICSSKATQLITKEIHIQ